MSRSTASGSGFPSAVTARRRALARSARRLLSALVRGRVGRHPWPDDRANVRDLLLRPASSIASCPLCHYRGPLLTFAGRARELCPRCHSKARHRALAVALDGRFEASLLAEDSARRPWSTGLHLAPEACLQPLLGRLCDRWVTADLAPLAGSLDVGLDLTRTPFDDARFDVVVASHVLEHIVEDRRAIGEVFRILRPGGTAILIVPLVAEKTVDFGVARAEYNDHARDCGLDYFDRYREAGFDVEIVRADRLPGTVERGLVSPSSPSIVHHLPFCHRPTSEGQCS